MYNSTNAFSIDNITNSQDFNFLEQLNNSDLFSNILNDEYIDDSPYANTHIQCKYADEYAFANEFSNINSFSYMTFNIQSLQSKFNQFQDMMQNLIDNHCAPDVILLQEIWKIHDSAFFQLSGYNFIFKSRRQSQGGGVGIYIKSAYRYSILDSMSIFVDHIYESLFIEIWLTKNSKKIIGNIYRPPSNHPNLNASEQFLNFFDLFSNTLNNTLNLHSKVIIGGDFNLDVLKYGTIRNVTDDIDLLFSYGFLQLVMRPTRCTDHSATLIDHFISNDRADINETILLTSKISDHFLVIYISKSHKNKHSPTLISYRDFSQSNFNCFMDSLNSINWDVLPNFDNTQQSYDYFSETFLSLFNLYFPLLHKKANKNNNPMNPWMIKAYLSLVFKKSNFAQQI